MMKAFFRRAMVAAAFAAAAACAAQGQPFEGDGGPGSTCGNGATLCGDVCTNTENDNANCGACGTACKSGEVCSQGKCGTSCGGGTTLCGAICAETKVDPANCGACGTKCASGQACVNGSCASTCGAGQTLCGADGGAPYCATTASDNANCGACGVACGAGELCENGSCTNACASPDGGVETLCTPEAGPAYCADTTSDNENCGACGVTCGAGETCKGGACTNACAAADGGLETLCTPDAGPAYCANTLTDPNNCGACGAVCSSGKCAGGACVSTGGNDGGGGGGVQVFDSLLGTVSVTTRGSGDSCGTEVKIASQVTIAYIAQRNNLNAAGNMKFMIWQNGTLLYISSPVAVSAGDSWKMSPFVNMTLAAGTYDFGAISDTAGTWDFDTSAETAGPFTSLVSNPNWTGYASPTMGGRGAADCGIRLFE